VNPKNFFAELKRRNVYKVAIAYSVVAWLLLQAASILFPTFEAPPWTMKVFENGIAMFSCSHEYLQATAPVRKNRKEGLPIKSTRVTK